MYFWVAYLYVWLRGQITQIFNCKWGDLQVLQNNVWCRGVRMRYSELNSRELWYQIKQTPLITNYRIVVKIVIKMWVIVLSLHCLSPICPSVYLTPSKKISLNTCTLSHFLTSALIDTIRIYLSGCTSTVDAVVEITSKVLKFSSAHFIYGRVILICDTC